MSKNQPHKDNCAVCKLIERMNNCAADSRQWAVMEDLFSEWELASNDKALYYGDLKKAKEEITRLKVELDIRIKNIEKRIDNWDEDNGHT